MPYICLFFLQKPINALLDTENIADYDVCGDVFYGNSNTCFSSEMSLLISSSGSHLFSPSSNTYEWS